MPLLYGEEERAFRRLQEEIIKSTGDLSIFAWTIPRTMSSFRQPEERIYSGVLADSPTAFSRSNFHAKRECIGDISITNRGIKCQVAMRVGAAPERPEDHYILLVAGYNGIRVRKYNNNQFAREDPHALVGCMSTRIDPPQEVYLLIDPPATPLRSIHLREMRAEVLRIKLSPNMRIRYDGVEPKGRYDVVSQVFFTPEHIEWDPCILSLSLDIDSEFEAKFTVLVMHPFSVTHGHGSNHVGLFLDEFYPYELAVLRDEIRKQTYSHERIQRYIGSTNIELRKTIYIRSTGGYIQISAIRNWRKDDEICPSLCPQLELSSHNMICYQP